MAHYTEAAIVKRLGKAAREAGGQARWSREHDIAAQTVNDVLHFRRPVSDAIAAALGYERVPTRFRRVSE